MREQMSFPLAGVSSGDWPTLATAVSSLESLVAFKGARNGNVPDATKLRGGYYTPPEIATFLARWAVRDSGIDVLEPSCGDGALVAAAAARLDANGTVTAIELFEDEARKAQSRGQGRAAIVVGDAFSWFNATRGDGQFDACVGNPPFIRFQSFPEAHRIEAFALMEAEGLRPTRLTNAWVPFVVLATRALRECGRLAFVVPAELLQVGYAADLREYLARRYSQLTVVTFRELLFRGIQQETVLLLGTRGDCDGASISFVELDSMSDLGLERVVGVERVESDLDHSREKWTQYFLSADELSLIRGLETTSALTTLGDLAEVDVGVVTGRNEFFVLTPSQADGLGLRDSCLRLVGRSAQIPGLVLRDDEWNRLALGDGKCLLLQLDATPRDRLSDAARAYVEWGERHGVQDGYKCRIRKPHWWKVPSVWAPDAFLLRQIHEGPRVVVNRATAVSTDTIHRMRARPGVDARALATASINSVTFAFAEIRGRSYGGGVLELEPTEAESLPIPYPNDGLCLDELDALTRARRIEDVLDRVDSVVLRAAGLDASDIARVRAIWRKLSSRRAARKRRVPSAGASPRIEVDTRPRSGK
jgi:adenine-specific DNA methylase